MSGCGLPNEFCFINLNKGVKVIGSICIVTCFICSILLMVYLFTDYDSIAAELSDNNESVKEKMDEYKSVRAIAGVFLGVLILYAVASIFLIKGAREKSRKLFVPYLIMTVAVIIISFIIACLQFNHDAFYAVLTVSLVLIYFFICVLSLYKKMSD